MFGRLEFLRLLLCADTYAPARQLGLQSDRFHGIIGEWATCREAQGASAALVAPAALTAPAPKPRPGLDLVFWRPGSRSQSDSNPALAACCQRLDKPLDPPLAIPGRRSPGLLAGDRGVSTVVKMVERSGVEPILDRGLDVPSARAHDRETVLLSPIRSPNRLRCPSPRLSTDRLQQRLKQPVQVRRSSRSPRFAQIL
jgi:hypothetical protein